MESKRQNVQRFQPTHRLEKNRGENPYRFTFDAPIGSSNGLDLKRSDTRAKSIGVEAKQPPLEQLPRNDQCLPP